MDQQESRALGERLRALRQDGFPGVKVTQRSLAAAFGVVMSSVSAWESGKIPPPNRLDAYATLFATPRSVRDGSEGSEVRVLPHAELTTEERAVRERLLREFTELTLTPPKPAPTSPSLRLPSEMWSFGARERVRIICGAIDADERPSYSNDDSPNYMQLTSYADLDSMVELFGHLRAANPIADVRFELAKRVESDDMRDHIVLLGGEVMNEKARMFVELASVPVRQFEVDDVSDGEIFRLGGDQGHAFAPRYVDEESADSRRKRLVADVGMFFRTQSPFNADRTLTMCSGVFARGVYGAVRMFTDKKLRKQNEAEVARIFGDSPTFGILVQVPVFGHATPTPDLRVKGTILHAWDGDGPVAL